MSDVLAQDGAHLEFGRSLRMLGFIGTVGVGLFAGTLGLWAVGTILSGAVIANGEFVVEGNVKKIQHPVGGVVGELRVHEGDHVVQDQILIKLDDTATRANLLIVVKQLDELAARRARLVAERDRKGTIAVPLELQARSADPEIADLIGAERGLFNARQSSRDGQKAQIAKRIAQLQSEIGGLAAQQAARDRQAALIADELLGVRGLYAKNLVSLSRKSQLEREAANLEGQKGQLVASIAQAEEKILEAQLQIIQIDDALREDVMKELRENQAKMAELVERRIAAEDQLKRVDIRAPTTGFVHQLAVHTVGEVITPAEPAMLIIPSGDALQIEARIKPSDIDQITPGSATRVRLHAFNQRSTPELNGVVSRIAPDISRDTQTGATYYVVRISVSNDELARLAPHHVTAGMQADILVKTEDRTPLAFLMKPFRDQVAKAFRER